MPLRLLRALRTLARHELALLSLIAALAALLWAFAEIAEQVRAGGTQSFDERILLALRNTNNLADPIGPPWVEEMARDFTALGGIGVVAFFGIRFWRGFQDNERRAKAQRALYDR